MDRKLTFQVTPSEEREIKECGRLFFKGGNPAALEETKEAWEKWNYFFTSFLFMRDARYGNILHLPFEGGVLNQPAKTMAVYGIIQTLFCEKLMEDMDKALKANKPHISHHF